MGLEGVVIGRLAPGGAGERAGLRATRQRPGGRLELGDVIVKVDGERVEMVDDLLTILDRHQVGEPVTMEYLREGRRQQVTVTLQAVQ
ncbi:MAG: PDZ domain-containing protein [Nitrospirales bacterium]